MEATSEVTESSAAPLIEAKGAREEQLLRDVQVQAGEVAKSSSEAEGIDVVRGAFDHEINAEVEVAAEQNSKKARKATRHAPAEKAVKRSEPLTERMRLREPKTKGAASARASIGAKQSTGRISASTGASMNYAAVVRARVAAHKPIGGGDRGTVVVAFGVSGTGALRSARIVRSSGNFVPGRKGAGRCAQRRTVSATAGRCQFEFCNTVLFQMSAPNSVMLLKRSVGATPRESERSLV